MGPSSVRSVTLWTGTSRSSWALICSMIIGVPVVTMVIATGSFVLDLGDRQAFDVVAAAGKQADDAGQHARFVVDDHAKRVAFDASSGSSSME